MTRAKFVCANCGNGIPKKTETIYAPRVKDSMAPAEGWQYRGNMQIVSRRYYGDASKVVIDEDSDQFDSRRIKRIPIKRREHRNRKLYCVSVWDGESYAPEYGYFCKTACAAEFGMKACEVGFKREGATK